MAMGVPRQEQFIHKHGDELGATVRPGVGALFDFFRLDAAGAMACAQAGDGMAVSSDDGAAPPVQAVGTG
ncbi:MAG: WecB/TagA/CpsF family glycosyltransferase [Betaproteobacteria bacterium]|nr:WecB/TagA/CpsF family glycosyltransferase [Betaproteobacteria bacterium]